MKLEIAMRARSLITSVDDVSTVFVLLIPTQPLPSRERSIAYADPHTSFLLPLRDKEDRCQSGAHLKCDYPALTEEVGRE